MRGHLLTYHGELLRRHDIIALNTWARPEEIEIMLKAGRNSNSTLLNQALNNAEKIGIKRIARYTVRHFIAARVHGLTGSNVGHEQRSQWLGDRKRDATSWYETHNPEFLRECASTDSSTKF